MLRRRRVEQQGATVFGAPGSEERDDPQAKRKKRESQMALTVIGVVALLLLVATAILVHLQRHWGIDRETPSASDVLLVSFPKSGSNWLRFLVLSMAIGGRRQSLSFPIVESMIPDLEYGMNRLNFRKKSKLAWKSHQPFRAKAAGPAEKPGPCNMPNMESFQCLCPNCPTRWSRLVYLVRDGRSTLCSYYHMQTELGNFEGSFEAFLRSTRSHYGVPWSEHVLSYLDNPAVYLLQYEDLHKRPLETLRHLADWLWPEGPSVSDDDIRAALTVASFDSMRRSELSEGTPLFDKHYPDARAVGGFKLVREGKVDGWTACTNDTTLFEAAVPGFSKVMTSLGYYPG